MNVINTDDLRPGQIFSTPVFSEGDCMLVSAMSPLRQKDIDVLVSLGIDHVRTEGELVEPEELSEPEELTEPEEIVEPEEIDEAEAAEKIIQIEEAAKEWDPNSVPDLDDIMKDFVKDFDIDTTEEKPAAPPPDVPKATIKFSISDVRHNSGPYRAYKNLIEKLNSIFAGLKSGTDVPMRAIDNISVQLLQDLRENPDSFVGFILGGEVSGHELAKSSVNTAILSALISQELKIPHHKINNIVSGALLHDVGMLRLSKGITEKKGGLSELELEQIKSHPLHTSKIVTKELFGPHEVNSIALHHHERWDGQGYPDGLVGQAIDIGARIVSVADAFEAMVTKKSYRNSMVGYQALKNLLADNARRFDPNVIFAFTKIMGIYPIGSIVRLNDKSVARVLSIHTEAPLRPVVQMLMDKHGKVHAASNLPKIDLLDDRSLFIKEAIDPAEYAEQ
ncbi:MAG: HD-GYP domain-containing protein [Treponema sp.]|nr:HD-GYP domain-containing protein [Treponema sp.]